jgi:hypothetical protein
VDLWSARASAALDRTASSVSAVAFWIAEAVASLHTMAPAVLNGHVNSNGAKHATTTAQVSILTSDRVAC